MTDPKKVQADKFTWKRGDVKVLWPVKQIRALKKISKKK